MKKDNRKFLLMGLSSLAAFLLWTAVLLFVDVKPIGPLGSAVGLASLNQFVHALTGVHLSLYILTDYLSILPLGFMAGFALLGLQQWTKRKHLRKVDRSILVLGGFYAAVIAVYVLFEILVINYRPILMEGVLEASYPSSTTLLVLCVIPTTVLQLRSRIRNDSLRRSATVSLCVFLVFMVLARLISGVHWFTDILGGFLLSIGLVLIYHAVSNECAQ